MARSGSAGGNRPRTSSNDDQKAKAASEAADAAADEATEDADQDAAKNPTPDLPTPPRRFAARRLIDEPAQVGTEAYVVAAAFAAAGIKDDHELTIEDAQGAVRSFLETKVNPEEGR